MASREFFSQRKRRTWIETFLRPKERKMDMRFGTWKVRSLYRLRFLTAASRELVRYKLELVGVQEWDKVGTVREGAYIFFMEKEKKIVNWEKDFWYTSE